MRCTCALALPVAPLHTHLLNTPEHFYDPTACVVGNGPSRPARGGGQRTQPHTHRHTHTHTHHHSRSWFPGLSLDQQPRHAGPRDQREGPDVHNARKVFAEPATLSRLRGPYPHSRWVQSVSTCRPPSIYVCLSVSSGLSSRPEQIKTSGPPSLLTLPASREKLRLTRPARDCPLPPALLPPRGSPG